MPDASPPTGPVDDEARGLLPLAGAALLGGLLIGAIGAGFRHALDEAELQRTAAIVWAHQWPWLGWLLPVLGAALGAALARALVRISPLAAGSGVQHVEAVMRGEADRAPLSVVPIKFLGGFLAIGSGLALGREGPTVQMGATLGAEIAQRLRMGWEDLKNLQTALAGAGLAVAFNAPVGGALFVFEEVARSFKIRLTAATLIGTASAVAVSRILLGNDPDFTLAALSAVVPTHFPAYLAFGAALGLLGTLYNRITLLGLDLFASFPRIPVEARAAAIGAVVGIVGWFAPLLVGGGDALNQRLLSSALPIGALLVLFAVRWILGPLSYSGGTPGGLFAPLLVVGSAFGCLSGVASAPFLPAAWAPDPTSLAVVGMSAFFTAIVRAPLTGIVLITEMTASTELLLPMLASNFAALCVTTLLKSPPIYDTLRQRMLKNTGYLSHSR